MAKKIKIIKNDENNTTLEKTGINQNKNTFKNLLDRYNSSQLTSKYIFDLQTLYLLRQNRILGILNKRYQYDTSLKRGQEFLLNHINSKISLVVMYVDLVDSTEMSRDLPIDKLVTVIRAFTHELSSVIENYDGLILKYVGDGIISFFPSGFNKYLACDKAVQCAKSMIDIIKNGINPILSKCDYPTLSIKIGIDEGENAIVQYGYDKSSLIDIVGYSMNIAAKITALTNKNKISVGEDIYKLLHPTIQSEFHELILHTNEWKYTNRTTNKTYKVYTIH
ncbi:MAG TPA: adenylate/guanylate cyclase domain-containing protein [Nitrososphaeraceae archaeon]